MASFVAARDAAGGGEHPPTPHNASQLRKQSSVAIMSRADSMANVLRSASSNKQRVLHPNAAMIVRAIARDDLGAFVRELLLVAPTAEQLARSQCPPGSGYVTDPTMDEENAVTKYVLKEGSGCDAAHLAAANDAFTILNYILRMQNADLRDSRTLDTHWTPLHFAAFNQSERNAALLRSCGADLFSEDVYGERPCDVAAALGNRMLAERLGDTSATSEDDEKKTRAYQQLLAQARAFEESRAQEQEAERRRAQERQRIQQQQAEAAAHRRKVKAQYEAQRIMFIRERWLSARQSFVRDFISEQWTIASDWVSNAMRVSAERAAAEDLARREAEEAKRLLEASRRRKSKGGKKGKGAARKRSASPSSPSTAQGLGAVDDPLAAFLSGLEEEALPEVNDRMTKEQKAEMAKVRAKLLKERKARRDAEIARFKELQLAHLRAQDELEDACLSERVDVENMWFSGIGNLTSYDPCSDRKHSGFFRYEPFDNRFRWSCCGQRHDPFALGCLPAEDRSRAFVHTGGFRFHILGCACGGTCVGSATTPPKTKNAQDHLPPLPDRGGHRLSGFVDTTGLANRQERNQRRLGPQVVSYCNPGGCCWSCCGATTRGASGCAPQYRFLYATHLLCDVRFSPADPSSTITQLVRDLSEERGGSGSLERPTSPMEARSAMLEEKSQSLVMSLLVPSDPEHTTDISFIVGENGVALQSDADRDGGVSFDDMLDAQRRKYTHALRTPDTPYCTMHNGLIRVSANGRCVEHMTPPLTSKKTLWRTAPTASQPLAARATRINLLGNVVMRGDFLADVRRLEAAAVDGEEAAMESAQANIDMRGGGVGADDLDLGAAGGGGPLMSSSSFVFGSGGDPSSCSSAHACPPPACDPVVGRTKDPTLYVRALPGAFASHGLAHEHAGDHASYAFEVRLTCCPVPASVTDERLVVGIVQAQLPPPDEMVDGGGGIDETLSDEEGDAAMTGDVGRSEADSPAAALGEECSVDFTAIGGGDGDSPRRARSPAPRVPQRSQRNATMWSTTEEGDDEQAEALAAAREAHRRKTLAMSSRRRTGSMVSFAHGPNEADAAQPFSDVPDDGDDGDAASALGSGSSAMPSSFCSPSSPNNIFHVSRRTRAYAARAGSYVSGPHGIGWWAFTSSLRGLGQEHDMGAVLEEGDLVTFVVDGMNASLHVFHNRSHAFSMRLPDTTTSGYVPAMTLVAGCRVDVEYVNSRLPYIDKWWREKALSERMLRMTTSAQLLDARLAAVEEAKRQSSSRGGPLRRVASHAGSLRSMRSSSMDIPKAPIDEDSEIRY